ncbi:MAG: DUF2283 domain-containing protein [Candidatus Asgardarchaeum californiense]|nr:MAG: DUF2283 domain-containing protein [Candidatus Asgardarchaeum californiense]
MNISYDRVADALYIKFSNENIAESDEISDGIILDYNKDGKIIGIEILNYSKRNIDLNKLIMLHEEEIVAEVAVCR